MSKPENALKKTLLKWMGTQWDVQSHEDKYTHGIPDLSFGTYGKCGWIELKRVIHWPMREDTLIKFHRYTAEQVNWLRGRGKKGGHCFVLVQVEDTYFLFSWEEARNLRNGLTRKGFFDRSIHNWKGTINLTEFIHALISC